MKNLILTLLAVILTVGVGLPEAEARRLGGGGSLGMQRQTTPPPQAPRQATPQQQTAPAAAPATQPRRSWMGPVAGLAAGLGLAALFSHLGLSEELASFVMILLLVLAAFAIFRLLTRRRTSPERPHGMQYAGAGPATGVPMPRAPEGASLGAGPGDSSVAPSARFPAGFDAEGFARQAKVNFIRLQAAHDAANLDDIREFTTPEMYAEIRMQMADRGDAAQQTDVVELNAEVLEVVEEQQRYIASVRFNGLLREEADAAPAPFDEIWHLVKARSGPAGWVIAGIQQRG